METRERRKATSARASRAQQREMRAQPHRRSRARVTTEASTMLLSLPSDQLYRILALVSFPDHDALRCTCKDIQQAMTTTEFRAERALRAESFLVVLGGDMSCCVRVGIRWRNLRCSNVEPGWRQLGTTKSHLQSAHLQGVTDGFASFHVAHFLTI